MYHWFLQSLFQTRHRIEDSCSGYNLEAQDFLNRKRKGNSQRPDNRQSSFRERRESGNWTSVQATRISEQHPPALSIRFLLIAVLHSWQFQNKQQWFAI